MRQIMNGFLFADNKQRCPICYRHLKTWPVRLGAEFVCMSPHRCSGPNADGSGKRATRNLAGDDRLTCFNCDFDMCRSVTDEGRLGTDLGGFHLVRSQNFQYF